MGVILQVALPSRVLAAARLQCGAAGAGESRGLGVCAEHARLAARGESARAMEIGDFLMRLGPGAQHFFQAAQTPAPELRSFDCYTPKKALYGIFRAAFNSALDAQQQPRWDSAPAGSRHPHSQRRPQNCKAHSQVQAQPITWSPKALVRAPSEQSKVYERLEESVAKKVNLCAAAASIITGTRRYFALSASLGPRSPRFENAGLRRNGGGKLVQRGDRRRG